MSITLLFYSFSWSKSFQVFLLQISTVCLHEKDDFIKPTLRFLSLDIGCLFTSRGLILRISVVNLAKANTTDGYLACVPVSIHNLPGCRWKLMRDRLVVFYSTERDCRGEKRRRLEERDQTDSENTKRLMGILCLHSVLTGKLSFGELFRTAQVVEVWVQILVKQQPGLHLCGQRRVIEPAHQKTTTATWQKNHTGGSWTIWTPVKFIHSWINAAVMWVNIEHLVVNLVALENICKTNIMMNKVCSKEREGQDNVSTERLDYSRL